MSNIFPSSQTTNITTIQPAKFYVRFIIKADIYGEDYNYYILINGNEKAIESLKKWVDKYMLQIELEYADFENRNFSGFENDKYFLYLDPIPESEALILVKHSHAKNGDPDEIYDSILKIIPEDSDLDFIQEKICEDGIESLFY